MDSNVSNFLFSLIFTLPFLFVYFIGLILSIIFRGRLGRVWLFAVFAFLLHLLGIVIGIIHSAILQFYIIKSGDYSSYETMSYIYSFILIFLNMIAYIFLFIALFARRSKEV